MRTLYILVLLLGVPLIALTLANRPPPLAAVWLEVEPIEPLDTLIDRGWLPSNTPRQSEFTSFLRLELNDSFLASFMVDPAGREALFAGIEPAVWSRYPGPVDDEDGFDLLFFRDSSGKFVVVSSAPFEILAYGVLMDRGVEWRYMALSDDTVILNCGPLPLFAEPAAESAS